MVTVRRSHEVLPDGSEHDRRHPGDRGRSAKGDAGHVVGEQGVEGSGGERAGYLGAGLDDRTDLGLGDEMVGDPLGDRAELAVPGGPGNGGRDTARRDHAVPDEIEQRRDRHTEEVHGGRSFVGEVATRPTGGVDHRGEEAGEKGASDGEAVVLVGDDRRGVGGEERAGQRRTLGEQQMSGDGVVRHGPEEPVELVAGDVGDATRWNGGRASGGETGDVLGPRSDEQGEGALHQRVEPPGLRRCARGPDRGGGERGHRRVGELVVLHRQGDESSLQHVGAQLVVPGGHCGDRRPTPVEAARTVELHLRGGDEHGEVGAHRMIRAIAKVELDGVVVAKQPAQGEHLAEREVGMVQAEGAAEPLPVVALRFGGRRGEHR